MLRKEPMSKDVRPGDRFSVNDAFTSKLYKVKIGMVTAQARGGGATVRGIAGLDAGGGVGGGASRVSQRCFLLGWWQGRRRVP